MKIILRPWPLIFLVTLLGLGLSSSCYPAAMLPNANASSNSNSPAMSNPAKEAEFRAAMRHLWEDHITWTRLFIVSAAADLPDKAATTERLLKNQSDIGNAMKTYYGNEAGDKLTGLLKVHITTAAELVAAAKAKDTAKVEDAKKRWYSNSDEISAFLSGANAKNWPAEGMKKMMRDHLDLTMTEATARLSGDWAADIAAYDKVHLQILHMSDMLSSGIIKQFPEKFR
jgi:hypothetical protein